MAQVWSALYKIYNVDSTCIIRLHTCIIHRLFTMTPRENATYNTYNIYHVWRPGAAPRGSEFGPREAVSSAFGKQ